MKLILHSLRFAGLKFPPSTPSSSGVSVLWNGEKGRVKFKAKCNYYSLSLQPQEVCMKVLVVQVFRVVLLIFAISQLTASDSRTQVLLLRRCLRLRTSSASGQTTFGACIMYADLFSSSRWPAFSLRHDCSIAFRWIHPARLLYIERTCFVELWYYLYNCQKLGETILTGKHEKLIKVVEMVILFKTW